MLELFTALLLFMLFLHLRDRARKRRHRRQHGGDASDHHDWRGPGDP